MASTADHPALGSVLSCIPILYPPLKSATVICSDGRRPMSSCPRPLVLTLTTLAEIVKILIQSWPMAHNFHERYKSFRFAAIHHGGCPPLFAAFPHGGWMPQRHTDNRGPHDGAGPWPCKTWASTGRTDARPRVTATPPSTCPPRPPAAPPHGAPHTRTRPTRTPRPRLTRVLPGLGGVGSPPAGRPRPRRNRAAGAPTARAPRAAACAPAVAPQSPAVARQ